MRKEKTSWKELILEAMEENCDRTPPENLIYAITHACDIERKFDAESYGVTEGCSFACWSDSHVYFPLCYDGREWVGSAPRNPNGIPLAHQGGG